MRDSYPAVTLRAPLDDNATYFGPYYNGNSVKSTRFCARSSGILSTKLCLVDCVYNHHIGLCPGVEAQKITSHDYKETLHKLSRYFKGERKAIIAELETEMKKLADAQKFEEAGVARNRIRNLRELQRQIVFGDSEFIDISKDCLTDLADLLQLQEG
jgi:excinuclease ABC subunit C